MALVGAFGALLFSSARDAIWWFVALIAFTAVSGLAEPIVSGEPGADPGPVQNGVLVLNICGVALTAYLLLQSDVRARDARWRAPSGCS